MTSIRINSFTMGASRTPHVFQPQSARRFVVALLLSLSLAGVHGSARPPRFLIPSFAEVSVHDPSLVRSGSQYYIFGSHLAAARSMDWQQWTQISTDPVIGNPLFPNPQEELQEALEWTGEGAAYWAPDVIRLADGRFYYYYCIGRLDAPRAALGVAVSDSIEGPYSDLGIMLRSGMWGQPSEDGSIYDPTVHPNAVDPDVFFDETGRLWMVYGSYSGGIFILEMNTETGFPLPGQGYGKRLIGGHHARIEGAFMLYSPESDYYYMFLSFGGLAADGGYNIRVARSRQPDGPYFDAAGNDMTQVAGTPGTLFDDAAIEAYGVKLVGNWQFLPEPDEDAAWTTGYRSPGHNSAYYDPMTGKHFLVFHTRFVGRGEEHQVRVHQLYMNDDEWLVAVPHRYAGERLEPLRRNDVHGDYKLIQHGREISPAVNVSERITLKPNGSVHGAMQGTWKLSHGNAMTLTLGGERYRGVFTTQWDDDHDSWVYAFSALSADGLAVWGSKVVASKHKPKSISLRPRHALYGHQFVLAMPRPSGSPWNAYSYAVVEGPPGLSIDRTAGMISWEPTLAQVDLTYEVKIRVRNVSPDDQRDFVYQFSLTAMSANVVRRVDLDFTSAAAGEGILDADGVFTGFTTRLPGTGEGIPELDPNLRLNAESGALELRSTQADFVGAAGLSANSAPGIGLADLGFDGDGDFAVTAVFRPLPALEFIDQVGLYVGASSAALTRAGTIVWGEPERYAAHSENGVDHSARFFGFGFDGSDGMTVTLTREAGVWRHFVDGVDWTPETQPAFLDGLSDLTAGVFAITPINSNSKTLELERFTLVLDTGEPRLNDLEQWRIIHFAQLAPTGIAADQADPDRDRRRNLHEFERGTDPLVAD